MSLKLWALELMGTEGWAAAGAKALAHGRGSFYSAFTLGIVVS